MTTISETEFAELAERHRRELRVHCYRMLGSLQDAEDLVQETYLRAWRGLGSYAGRASFRAWLYKIATNACLDALDRRPQPAEGPVPWLTPCPTDLLDDVVSRETVELAFLGAVQHLPPRQRAVLVLRDVLGWSAKETAGLLDLSVPAANSALQRARDTMRARLPARAEWSADAEPDELAVARAYLAALEAGDQRALGAMLAEDAACRQAPWAGGNMSDGWSWYAGRETLVDAWRPVFEGPSRVTFTCVLTSANRMPAIATYADGRAFGLTVLDIRGGQVREVTVFGADLYPRFGLPLTTA